MIDIEGFHVVAIVAIICWTVYYCYKRKREYDAKLYKHEDMK